ncbi:MAG TPA: S8 family serine peptidase [Baekduia sp.]|uniref:S8 family serine peptidase n=1 Tax=Baekduia sp. TaxID=2600305 RepID=UPI002D78BE40|nr:S8 family serine peptidase [Baekduia sp.]HET6506229.1 S8 family serine peptidase [Baekduia sp.]
MSGGRWGSRIGTLLGAVLLAAVPAGVLASSASADRLIVGYRDGVGAARRASAREAVDGKLVGRLPALSADVVTVPAGDGADALAELRDRSGVRYAERDVVDRVASVPDDPGFGSLWNLARIGAPTVWDRITDSSSVVVAVVDSGVALTHPDLAGELWHNPGETGGGREDNGIDDDHNGFVDDAVGWNFHDNDNDPSPNHPHGTHVAGTIGATGDNGLGVTGVAWRSTIMPVGAMGPDGTGYRSDIARAFDYAASNGARIVNASLAGTGRSDVYRDVMAAHPDTLFVVAAGNDGSDDDAVPITPCDEDVPNLICVAASDRADRLADFSNYGATDVDIAAPGVDILSLFPDDTLGVMSGTSMATPLVTGVAALTLAAHPWLTTTELRDAVLAGARRLPSLDGLVATGGRLDAPGAMAAAGDRVAPSTPAITAPAGDGWSAGAPVVRWTAAADDQSGVAGYDVDVDGRRVGSVAAGTTELALPALPDGHHSVIVTARDGEGNRAPSAARAFATDATAPVPPAPRTPGARARVRRGALAFAFAPAADATSGLRGTGVLLDGRPVALDAFGRPRLRARLAEGAHRWSTTAVDNAGNAAASAPVAFTLDDRAPTVSLAGARRLRVRGGTVAVTLRTDEASRATVELVAGATAARALHLPVRGRSARLGSTTVRLGTAPRTLRLRVARDTLRRLALLRRVKLRVAVVATDGAGNRRSVVLAGRT